MRVGSLFTGIGGFDLGFERAGCEIAWQCEIDSYCRSILAKQWPQARIVDDVKLVGTHHPFDMCPPECEEGCERDEYECIGVSELADEPIDILIGGFPCQDISNAGTTHAGGLTGLAGSRSGLWAEFHRVIRVSQPRYVVIENVGALSTRGLDTVLGDLADCGYDAEWSVLSAAALGAPHLRRRLFIVGWHRESLTDTDRKGLEGYVGGILAQPREGRQDPNTSRPTWRYPETRITRSDDGVSRGLDGTRVTFATGESIPHRKERIKALGNAVDVRVSEWIASRLVSTQNQENSR